MRTGHTSAAASAAITAALAWTVATNGAWSQVAAPARSSPLIVGARTTADPACIASLKLYVDQTVKALQRKPPLAVAPPMQAARACARDQVLQTPVCQHALAASQHDLTEFVRTAGDATLTETQTARQVSAIADNIRSCHLPAASLSEQCKSAQQTAEYDVAKLRRAVPPLDSKVFDAEAAKLRSTASAVCTAALEQQKALNAITTAEEQYRLDQEVCAYKARHVGSSCDLTTAAIHST